MVHNLFSLNRYLEETLFCLLSLEAWRKCRAELWCSSCFTSGASLNCSGLWDLSLNGCVQNSGVVSKNL